MRSDYFQLENWSVAAAVYSSGVHRLLKFAKLERRKKKEMEKKKDRRMLACNFLGVVPSVRYRSPFLVPSVFVNRYGIRPRCVVRSSTVWYWRGKYN